MLKQVNQTREWSGNVNRLGNYEDPQYDYFDPTLQAKQRMEKGRLANANANPNSLACLNHSLSIFTA
jgi:hypothetical protein